MKNGDYIWELLVPVSWNTGRDIPISHHRDWDAKVRDIADGLTILKAAKGQWISPDGDLYSEHMIPVRVACTEEEIKKIARFTLSHYNQEKVMFYRIADKVYIYS